MKAGDHFVGDLMATIGSLLKSKQVQETMIGVLDYIYENLHQTLAPTHTPHTAEGFAQEATSQPIGNLACPTTPRSMET